MPSFVMVKLGEPVTCENLDCGHKDCEATRKLVGSRCKFCFKKINTGDNFLFLENEVIAHTYCLEKE